MGYNFQDFGCFRAMLATTDIKTDEHFYDKYCKLMLNLGIHTVITCTRGSAVHLFIGMQWLLSITVKTPVSTPSLKPEFA
jgi:hypothetical protein